MEELKPLLFRGFEVIDHKLALQIKSDKELEDYVIILRDGHTNEITDILVPVNILSEDYTFFNDNLDLVIPENLSGKLFYIFSDMMNTKWCMFMRHGYFQHHKWYSGNTPTEGATPGTIKCCTDYDLKSDAWCSECDNYNFVEYLDELFVNPQNREVDRLPIINDWGLKYVWESYTLLN